jgi:hypothetical protein
MVGYRFIGGLDNNHHQKVVILQKGYSIIRISLIYAGGKNLDIENDFDAIVRSMN